MGIAIVTGSGGLIGSESIRFFAEQGLDVIGLENDMRARFFGAEASTGPTSERLADEVAGFRSPAASRAPPRTAARRWRIPSRRWRIPARGS
jgi:CDP-paratose 2-epimerase